MDFGIIFLSFVSHWSHKVIQIQYPSLKISNDFNTINDKIATVLDRTLALTALDAVYHTSFIFFLFWPHDMPFDRL
jgi:hypothetical protein